MGRRLVVALAATLVGCGVLVAASDDETSPVPPGAEAGLDAVAPPGDDGGPRDDASDGGCGDTSSDPLNCGSCGHVCNLDAGCSSGACDKRVVFVSSAMYQGAGFMGTLGDQACTALARSVGLGGSYSVWLTINTPTSRFGKEAPFRYFTTTGDLVANQWPPGDNLSHPIDRDENGGQVLAYAWSNLNGDGGLTGLANNCSFWGTSDGTQNGTFGETSQQGSRWTAGIDTANADSPTKKCSAALHLYCVEYP